MSISSISATIPATKPLASTSASASASASASLSSSFLLRLPIKRLSALSLNASSSKTALISASMEAGIGVMGTKLGMMSYFDSTGTVIPVTVVGFREGNIVTQVKTEATDGYDAVQVGYRRVRDRKLTKPELGHLEKSGIIPMRHLQEFRLQSVQGFEPNQRLVVEELFKEGDLVDISGTTIGKGFQGIGSMFPFFPTSNYYCDTFAVTLLASMLRVSTELKNCKYLMLGYADIPYSFLQLF